MIGQYSCSAATRAASGGGRYINNRTPSYQATISGYQGNNMSMRPLIFPPQDGATGMEKNGSSNRKYRPPIYPPQNKISYSPSMRELAENYYGNEEDYHSNQDQILNPTNLRSYNSEQVLNHPGDDFVNFHTVPRNLGHSREWRESEYIYTGSDITASSLPRRPDKMRGVTRHSSLNIQNRTQNIAVVEPRIYQGQTRRGQGQGQGKPWQPQEIRSHVPWQPPKHKHKSSLSRKPAILLPKQQNNETAAMELPSLPPKQPKMQQVSMFSSDDTKVLKVKIVHKVVLFRFSNPNSTI